MNIEFRGKTRSNVVRESAIYVSGKVIGEVIERKRESGRGLRFQAVIRDFPGIEGLVQGHADTMEGAVIDAIVSTRKSALAMLEGLEKLQAELACQPVKASA